VDDGAGDVGERGEKVGHHALVEGVVFDDRPEE
jgi:hypothetical protein